MCTFMYMNVSLYAHGGAAFLWILTSRKRDYVHAWHDPCIWGRTHLREARPTPVKFACWNVYIHMSYKTWLCHMRHESCLCDVILAYVTWQCHIRHDFVICESCLMWQSHVFHIRHDSCLCDVTYLSKTRLIHMRCASFTWDMTHSCQT